MPSTNPPEPPPSVLISTHSSSACIDAKVALGAVPALHGIRFPSIIPTKLYEDPSHNAMQSALDVQHTANKNTPLVLSWALSFKDRPNPAPYSGRLPVSKDGDSGSAVQI